METYQRRRFRKCKEANSEMEQHDCKSGVHVSPPLFPTSDHGPIFQLNSANVDAELQPDYLFNNNQVEVGSVYEIDHVHLPPRTPIHLRSIRVAMVSEKTELNVAVRYPSMDSLQTYFSNSIGEMYPALDEKFVMGTTLATKVLLRQVPSQQFAENKHLKGFWQVNVATIDMCETDNSYNNGNCLAELKGNGMVRWGIRRQVKFLERHKENINDNVQSSASFYTAGSKKKKIDGIENQEERDVDIDDEEDEDDEQEGDEREDDKEAVDYSDEEAMLEEDQEMDRNLKRKRYKLRNSTRQNTKDVKLAKKQQQRKKTNRSHSKRGKNRCRELLVIDNPKDRWSAERYQLATENLLAVMKAKRATAGNPILRPDLREEARKRIGDTGLLDHLLKHMAGKLAPGGEERFRRRHNADGAMEYWLESADLVNIRKEAGVNDPFWIPPPGWKPGDCPTQDPICARELKLLKEEIYQLKRNARDMVPRKQLEQELGKLRREIHDKIVSNKQQKENLAIEDSSIPSDISQKLNQLANSLVTSKSDIAKAPVSLEKYNEQLLVIQDVVKGIEEEIKKLLSKDEEGKTMSELALMVPREAGAKEEMQLEHGRREQEVQVVNVRRAAAMAEEKAAKIERLKSGFRICKPQGTFLWPNMARSNTSNTTSSSDMASPQPQVVVQAADDHQDLFVVPTPPSVSSSTALVPPQLPYQYPNNSLRPSSPVKPLAERRAVTVTVSTLSNDKGDMISYSTSTKKYSPDINLNDIPSNPVVVGLIRTGSGNPSPCNWVASTTMPPAAGEILQKRRSRSWELAGSANNHNGAATENDVQKKLRECRSSYASTEKDMGTWLALATANSASDDSC